MKFTKMYNFLEKDLEVIEKRLAEIIDADHPVLREASLQLLQAGGKRIRPVFVLLSGYFGDYKQNYDQIISVAVSLELIHMATLVHDDVVDDAEIRRGKPTVKHIYGNKVAMYTGDYLLARALEEITKISDPTIHRTLSKTLVKLVEGEIDQIEDKYNMNQNLRHYLRRTKRKTAILIATSCKLGAIASGASKRVANHLYRYGYNVGMSFQIIDDILDFTASEEELGKPTGSDLIQGNITLPVHYAMQNKAFHDALDTIFTKQNAIKESDMAIILRLFKETDAIEQSYEISNIYLHKALKSLQKLENNRAKKSFQIIANTIGKRRS